MREFVFYILQNHTLCVSQSDREIRLAKISIKGRENLCFNNKVKDLNISLFLFFIKQIGNPIRNPIRNPISLGGVFNLWVSTKKTALHRLL